MQLERMLLQIIYCERLLLIVVQTQEFQFPGAQQTKRVRIIKVRTGNWAWFVNVVKAIASQPIKGINENRAIAGILGSEDEKDKEAVRQAFKKNYGFILHASYDLDNFMFNSIEDRATSSLDGSCVLL